ncbi:MAG: phage/plasmid primase, P4 family [Clostridia bacterium]|nr:phage/plasmid primase, P4 family [Clostridia bacterium]
MIAKMEINQEYVLNRLNAIEPLNNSKYENFDEIALSQLFAEVFKDCLTYNVTLKRFMYFDGTYWKTDDGTETERMAQEFATALYMHTLNSKRTDIKKRIFKLSERRARLNLIADAKTENRCSAEDFDKNPYELNCQNGILNLLDGSFKGHNAKDKFSNITNCQFEPDLDGENRWIQFIDEIMGGDNEKVLYLQTVLGYALLGTKREEKFWILYGPKTRNGKSTLMESIACCLGDYCTTAQPASFEKKQFNNGGSGASEDIARLAGTRLLKVSEPDKGMRLDCRIIKEMTGNSRITARGLHQSSFEFYSNFALVFDCNNLPLIEDDTVFSSNRVKVIRFDETFPDNSDRQDKTLKELFRTPTYKSIILNWLLEGLYNYNINGLYEPSVITEATEIYRAENDSIGTYLSEALEEAEAGYLKAADVFENYCDYCKITGRVAEGKIAFNAYLYAHGLLTKQKRISGTVVKNIILGYQFKS